MARLDDAAIARLAARQRGVVSIKQLHAAGFDTAAVKRRCRAGRLHRLHRGVYLVGHTVAPEHAAEVAALLACGAGSVVSHRSAARLWGLPTFRHWTTPVEIIVPGRDPGRRPGITIYRARTLDARDHRRVEGIRATTPARTLLDLAAEIPITDLEIACVDAYARGVVKDRDLADVLSRHRGRRGAKALRILAASAAGGGLSRSEAERRMLALVRTAALPQPQTNARVDRLEVDLLWPDQKLIVEVDGYEFHAGRHSFERDRERDAMLAARGYLVLRVTWRQLVSRRDAVIARVAAALARRA
jgi:very-short-patch-repair endonuclease